MEDWIKKEETKITGIVKSIYTINSFHGKPSKTYIELLCKSEKFKQQQMVRFNYSQSWQKLELQIDSNVEFLATIKTTTLIVHKETRQVDTWHVLPFELIDYEDIIEIQSPKKIKKV